MPVKLRLWLASLLMVLLPLQAFAGQQAVSCAQWMDHCPGLISWSDTCCDHGVMTKEGKRADGMAACAGATTCAPVAAAAALPASPAVLTIGATRDSWLAPEVSAFRSYIPDGLRRPPRFLA